MAKTAEEMNAILQQPPPPRVLEVGPAWPGGSTWYVRTDEHVAPDSKRAQFLKRVLAAHPEVDPARWNNLWMETEHAPGSGILRWSGGRAAPETADAEAGAKH